METPKSVSGRLVTERGVHLHPSGYHDAWMLSADYWIDLLVSMNMSWVLALSDGDNLYLSGAARALLEAGIIPIVRFDYQFPGQWAHGEHVAQLQPIYDQYGAPLICQFANEPFNAREWRDGVVPSKEIAWPIIVQRWHEAANAITGHGGIAGFPDGPGYDENPFMMIGDEDGHWASGRAVYLGHFYGTGRPIDYPEDDVSRNGTPLTVEEYRMQLDDFADDPDWYEGEGVLELMNQQRAEWADPMLTPLDDDTCWRGWEKVLWYAEQASFPPIQIAMTEGGWVPRDRAGSNPIDIRWPYTTPKMVATKTLQMYEYPSPLFAICPWLLADEDMGGSGWPYDAWHGWAYYDKYGSQKPVIQALQGDDEMHDDIEIRDASGTLRDWAWLVNKYGPIVIHSNFTGPGWRIVKIKENADVGLHNYRVLAEGVEIIGLKQAMKSHGGFMPEAPSVIIATVLDVNGSPVVGQAVPWYWPDAAQQTQCMPPNGLPDGMVWGRYAGPGYTNASGLIGFAMGNGAYYFPPDIGPHAVWICGANSEVIFGLGMLGGTNHFSLWPTFQWVEEEPPGDCPVEEIEEQLAGLDGDIVALRTRATMMEQRVQAIRDVLP